MFKLLIVLLLVSIPAHARPVTFESGVAEQMTVTATNEQVAIVSPDICTESPDRMGCEDVTYMPEQPHPCEINPAQVGCKFYVLEVKEWH